MAGVVSTQRPDMEDDLMQDASLLSVDHGGWRPESALASPGDPMDISPLPAVNQQNQQSQRVGEQQPRETRSQPITQPIAQPLGQASGYQRSMGFGASRGLQIRSSSFRFSPKDRTVAKKNQLKRIPLIAQAKLPLPVKPASRLPHSFASNHFSNQLYRNNFAATGSSLFASSTGSNRLHGNRSQNLPPVNRQLFKPPAQESASANFLNASLNGPTPFSQPIGRSSASSISKTPAFTAATEKGGGKASLGGFTLQRKRPMEEESNDYFEIWPPPVVSPRYRRIGQPNSSSAPSSPSQNTRQETSAENGAPSSPAQNAQQETSVENDAPFNSPLRPTTTPPTSSTLIPPFRPNTSVTETQPVHRADNPEILGAWSDMRELDQVFRDQGIAPFQEEPPVETQTLVDPIEEPIEDPNEDPLKGFNYRMPGSWPEDPPDFSEPIEEESLPAQDSALFGDHGLLMSDALDTSPILVPTTQQPVVPMSSQEPQSPHTCSQGSEASQMPDAEASQEEQPKHTSSQLSQSPSSLPNRLYRIYNNSWETTQCIATTAIAIAGSVKRRAVAFFEERPAPRRPNVHTTTTSTSPTRANVRALPEEQRRRLRSNEWRRDRGFPTMPTYPFPELSLDTRPPSPATKLSQVKPSQKPVTPVTKKSKNLKRLKHGAIAAKDIKPQSAKPGDQRRSLVQSLSPNMMRRIRVRSTKQRSRLDHSLLHAVKSGKLSVDEIPRKQKQYKQLAPTKPMETQLDPLLKPILRKPSIEHAPPKRTAPKNVRFDLDSIPRDDPSLVGQHLHPELPQPVDETTKPPTEKEENEPPKPTVDQDQEEPEDDLLSWLRSDFPFGRPVSAVRLFTADRHIPPGRTESIYAAKWRKIEEEEKRKEIPSRVRPEGPAVRLLPAKWETRLAEVASLPNNRQIATTLSGDPLTKRDLATCYTPMAWLNDEIINSYLALLVDYLRRAHGNAGRHEKPKFHAFNSFFFSNLRDKGYASVRRWAQRAKIGGESLLNVDTVFIPVHDSAHWTLIVVKPTSKSIEHFDSLGSPSAGHVAKVKEWLRGELLARYVDEEWSVDPSVSPQQNNGSDCGAFLLSTAKAVAVGIEPQSYGAKDIPLLRRKIVAELMAGGLGGEFEPEGETGEVLM